MNLKNYFLNQYFKYLKQSSSFVFFIILVDLLPLFAVLWWGWSAIEALYLYALETIILLWITLRKMWRSKYTLALFVDQAQSVANTISEHTPTVNLGFRMPGFSWVRKGARGILYFTFMILWLPLLFIQLMIISLVSGDGFGFWGFFEHNSGQLDLGIFSINLMLVFLFLLFIEHTYAYRTKFVKEKEYENTGLINEGMSFSLRVFIQQFILIGLFAIIGWMHIDSISMIFIILFKTVISVVSYLFNRIWGGITSKREGRN